MKKADFYIKQIIDDLPERKSLPTRGSNEGLQKFVCEYEYEGVMCTIAIYATDTLDAARRLGSISENATIRGPA